MSDAGQVLDTARTVVVIDWPTKDVPEALARAGYTVLVKGGPEPDNYSAYEVQGTEVVSRRTGAAPAGTRSSTNGPCSRAAPRRGRAGMLRQRGSVYRGRGIHASGAEHVISTGGRSGRRRTDP